MNYRLLLLPLLLNSLFLSDVARATSKTQDLQIAQQETSNEFPELQALLQAQNWYQANEETISIIRNNSSCPNLRNIDQLWVKYSNGKYGLTPQLNIWQQVGGFNCTTCQNQIEKFAKKVGWKLSIPIALLPEDFVGQYPIIAPLGWEYYVGVDARSGVGSVWTAWRKIKEFDIFSIWQKCQTTSNNFQLKPVIPRSLKNPNP